jgi:hypothetical protein
VPVSEAQPPPASSNASLLDDTVDANTGAQASANGLFGGLGGLDDVTIMAIAAGVLAVLFLLFGFAWYRRNRLAKQNLYSEALHLHPTSMAATENSARPLSPAWVPNAINRYPSPRKVGGGAEKVDKALLVTAL